MFTFARQCSDVRTGSAEQIVQGNARSGSAVSATPPIQDSGLLFCPTVLTTGAISSRQRSACFRFLMLRNGYFFRLADRGASTGTGAVSPVSSTFSAGASTGEGNSLAICVSAH